MMDSQVDDLPTNEDERAEQPSPSDLSVLFNDCLDTFRQFLRLLSISNTSEGERTTLRAVPLTKIDRAFDEYARLKIWGHDFRAGVPDSTRSSLGETLRQKDELREQVASIFLLLQARLTSALDVLSREENSKEESGDIDTAVSSDSSSDSDTPLQEDGGTSSRRRNLSILFKVMRTIFDQIQLLYYLGILLRRPGLSRKYLKSVSARAQASHPETAPEDLSHVRQVLQEWRDEPDREAGIHPDEEIGVTWEEIERRLDAAAATGGPSEVLIERLARANTRRREQLIYWNEHPDQVVARNVALSPEPLVLGTSPGRAVGAKDAKSVNSMGTSLFSRNTLALSHVAGPSSSVEETRHRVSAAPRTTYAETLMGGTHSSRVPDVPEESGTGDTFECPYCHLQLDCAPMRGDRNTWKRHVFRDLRPYTCTHSACPSGEKLYASKNDWVYHEMQIHRRQWHCSDCDTTVLSRDEMAAHLRSLHAAASLGGSRLTTLLEMHERPLDDAHPAQCPFCPKSAGVRALLEHIGQHMEELSLFVLPRPAEDNSEAGSNSSDKSSHYMQEADKLDDRLQDQTLQPSAVSPQPRPITRPVFGQSLQALYERDGLAVPMFVYQCIQAVDLYGLAVEGIYSEKSISPHHATQLRKKFDEDFSSPELDFRLSENFYNDIASVTDLLKQFFQDLPDPLLTQERHRPLVEAAQIADDLARQNSIHALVNELPDPNYAVMRAVTLHLYRVMENRHVNNMDSSRLAMIFGPILMRPIVEEAGEVSWAIKVIDTILQHTWDIFDDD